jgi:hypothetical protein
VQSTPPSNSIHISGSYHPLPRKSKRKEHQELQQNRSTPPHHLDLFHDLTQQFFDCAGFSFSSRYYTNRYAPFSLDIWMLVAGIVDRCGVLILIAPTDQQSTQRLQSQKWDTKLVCLYLSIYLLLRHTSI